MLECKHLSHWFHKLKFQGFSRRAKCPSHLPPSPSINTALMPSVKLVIPFSTHCCVIINAGLVWCSLPDRASPSCSLEGLGTCLYLTYWECTIKYIIIVLIRPLYSKNGSGMGKSPDPLLNVKGGAGSGGSIANPFLLRMKGSSMTCVGTTIVTSNEIVVYL